MKNPFVSVVACIFASRKLKRLMVDGNVTLSKVYLAALRLYVISTWPRLLASGLQAESHVVNCVAAEEDTQGKSFTPLGRRHAKPNTKTEKLL